MFRRIFLAFLVMCLTSSADQLVFGQESDDGWISLFDGRTLSGWKASENKSTFSVRDGMIVAQGPAESSLLCGFGRECELQGF